MQAKIRAVTKEIPIFKKTLCNKSEDEISRFISNFEVVELSHTTNIITEGDIGDPYFYIVGSFFHISIITYTHLKLLVVFYTS